MIPVRCFTCNKNIGNKWETYDNNLKSGKSIQDIFTKLDLTRYCCKRMFLGHVDTIDKLILHSENNDNNSNEKSARK